MSTADLEAFYAPDRIGNRFAVRGPFYRPRGHRGVDVIHAARTPVPSWCAGRVVVVEYYRLLGWTVIVERQDGPGYAGYCHLATRPTVEVGDLIDPGDVVGLVGSTGLFSTGPHLHATLEPDEGIGTARALDPLPEIQAALARLEPLAGSSQPIDTESDDDMTRPRIIAPYGLDARAVVGGGLAYVFPNPGELAHFRNFERPSTPDIDKTTIVGDAAMTPAARMAVFDTIVRIHESKQGIANALQAIKR